MGWMNVGVVELNNRAHFSRCNKAVAGQLNASFDNKALGNKLWPDCHPPEKILLYNRRYDDMYLPALWFATV